MTSEPTIPPVVGAIDDDRDGARTGIAAEVSRNHTAAPGQDRLTARSAEPGVTMVRSEERLSVSTEVVPQQRAVLRVFTTTEEVMVPVTVTRQHARIEYVDVDPTSVAPVADPLVTPGTGRATAWATLTADEPVVSTRPVPVERVRLVTEWVAGTQDVHAQVSHEVISTESTGDPARLDPELPPNTSA